MVRCFPLFGKKEEGGREDTGRQFGPENTNTIKPCCAPLTASASHIE